jgi:hypothetical protein
MDSSQIRYDQSWQDFKEYLRRAVPQNVYSLVENRDFDTAEVFLNWVKNSREYCCGRRSLTARHGENESMHNLLRIAHRYYQDRISATRVKVALRPFFSKSYRAASFRAKFD